VLNMNPKLAAAPCCCIADGGGERGDPIGALPHAPAAVAIEFDVGAGHYDLAEMKAFPHHRLTHLHHHDADFRWCNHDGLPQTQDAPFGNLTDIIRIGTSEQFCSALDVARIGRRRVWAQDGWGKHSYSVMGPGCLDKSTRRRPGEGWLNIQVAGETKPYERPKQ
jgi:hypothetical protein